MNFLDYLSFLAEGFDWDEHADSAGALSPSGSAHGLSAIGGCQPGTFGNRIDQLFFASRTRSTQVVSTRPAMKSGSRKIRRCKRDRGLDALDHQLVEGAPHGGDGLRAGGSVDDQLAQERVVIGRNGVADLDVRIPADAGPAGEPQRR